MIRMSLVNTLKPMHENHVEDHDGQTRGEETVSLDGTDSCVSCSRKADDDTIECQWCSHWEHKVCAKVSSEHYLLLDSTSQNMFFCTLCVSKVPQALHYQKFVHKHRTSMYHTEI